MRILRRFELDVLLATVCSPMLNNPDAIASLTLPPSRIDLRAVQLAALFLSGVEHVAFVNDACGAPIPPRDVAPWRIFDGRLFQAKYGAAIQRGAPLIELCDGNHMLVTAVEQLRAAVLEDLPRAQFIDDTPAAGPQCAPLLAPGNAPFPNSPQPSGSSSLIGMPGSTMFGMPNTNEQPEARLLVGGTPVGRWTNQSGFPNSSSPMGYPQQPGFGYPPNWYPPNGCPPNWYSYPAAPPFGGFAPPPPNMPMGNWYRPPMQVQRKFVRMTNPRASRPFVKRGMEETGKPSNGDPTHAETESDDAQHTTTDGSHDGATSPKKNDGEVDQPKAAVAQ